MDSQAIGPVEKSSVQVGQKLSSEGSKVSSGGSTTGQQSDTVSLSQRGQAAISQQTQSNNAGSTGRCLLAGQQQANKAIQSHCHSVDKQQLASKPKVTMLAQLDPNCEKSM